MGSGQPLPILLDRIHLLLMQGLSLTRFLSRYGPLLIWMAFISFASSNSFSASNTSRIVGPLVLWLFPNTTPEQLELIHIVVRKISHFLEYAILGFLAARAFRTSSTLGVRRRWFVIALGLVVVYAFLDEYHQSFVPSRTPSIVDSFIDILGGFTALLALRRRQHAERSSN
jgi:VanZ family protein